MSVKNLEVPVTWKGKRYPGIIELGFSDRGSFVARLQTTPTSDRGTGWYYSGIPISPIEYRKTYRTKTMVEDRGRYIIVYDDWGTQYHIRARRSVLKVLLAELDANRVPLLVGVEA